VKKTVLSAYSRPRKGGIQAINLDDDDELVGAAVTTGTQDVILAKRDGRAVRFQEGAVRAMGRTARGVKGVRVEGEDGVVGMVIVRREGTLLSVTENGYGKRTRMDEYPVKGRGGKGVINIKTSARNGKVVAIKEVSEEDELIMLTRSGIAIRVPVKGISVLGRNTQGVKLINLDQGDVVGDIARVVTEELPETVTVADGAAEEIPAESGEEGGEPTAD
jgi:DNA gyrase subunit A